jgi:TctA family transporter
MTISGGNPSIFVGSAITVTLLVFTVISIALPFLLPRLKSMRGSEDAA